MRHTTYAWAVLVLLCWGLGSCQEYPKDPGDTLQKVSGGTLLVGYSLNPPWVGEGVEGPTGTEADLVRRFAQTIQADVQWRQDTEQHLLEDLEKEKLHLVIAGLTDDSPWKSKISFTRPYLKLGKKKHVWAVIRGENAFIVKLETFLRQKEDHLNANLNHEAHQ